jgi:hypothetical protein
MRQDPVGSRVATHRAGDSSRQSLYKNRQRNATEIQKQFGRWEWRA